MKTPVLTIPIPENLVTLEAIWQRQPSLPDFRVINSIPVPNLESRLQRETRNLGTLTLFISNFRLDEKMLDIHSSIHYIAKF